MAKNYEEKELARFIAVALEKSKKISLKTLTETILNVQCVEEAKSFTILRFIIDSAAEEFGISKEDLMGTKKAYEIALCKRISILMAVKYTGFSDKKVAFEFNSSRQFIYKIKKEFSKMERSRKSAGWYFTKYDKLNEKVDEFVKGLEMENITPDSGCDNG